MPRGKKNKERSGYFYEKEQNALIEYLNSEDEDKKNEIFTTILHPAFTKMIESIIRRYNLFTPDEEFQDTFDDTISFLMSKISHYRPETGYKAYSYCGTVCKNYLLWKINQYNKNLKRNDSLENNELELNNNLKYSYSSLLDDNSNYLRDLFIEMSNKIESMIKEPTKNKLKENDIKVGEALKELFNNWDELFARMGTHKFNKSSIILFLQELTLLSAKEVKASINKFKGAYQNVKSKMADIYF